MSSESRSGALRWSEVSRAAEISKPYSTTQMITKPMAWAKTTAPQPEVAQHVCKIRKCQKRQCIRARLYTVTGDNIMKKTTVQQLSGAEVQSGNPEDMIHRLLSCQARVGAYVFGHDFLKSSSTAFAAQGPLESRRSSPRRSLGSNYPILLS